ncbi:MAG TPA: type II toxin-antitoxin system Phd/YefM family antitoxin [Chloroflexi bacterium]|nr:type II toxin-antitoxin system Phd/YefM family antitoxin [Chloroflexota bacterium]
MFPFKSKPVTVPATFAHRKFGDLIRRAFAGREHFIVEKDGLPVVAIISITEYEALMEERRQREDRLRRLEEHARALGEEAAQRHISEEQLLEELRETRQEIYREEYDNSR